MEHRNKVPVVQLVTKPVVLLTYGFRVVQIVIE